MSLPTFSVILPTYNRCQVVERTLDHLLAIDYPAGLYEILVADNSTDDTPEMVERLAARARTKLRLLRSEERLPAVKRNQGLQGATGDLVVFINDDLWVAPDFLREHAGSHADHDDPVAVVGQVRQSSQMPSTPFSDWYVPFRYDPIDHLSDQPVSYRFFWSMNLSLPRRTMLEHNLVFHEDWAEIGHEDIELGYRWTGAGFKVIFNPRASGEHYHPHTLDSACRLQESIGRGLRDLEWLIPEPDLLERYGVFTWRNSPRALLRGLARRVFFNKLSAPTLRQLLSRLTKRNRIAEWAYWKIMLHYTNHGYRQAPTRRPDPVPLRLAAKESER